MNGMYVTMQQRKNCQPGSKMHSALNNRSRRLQKCTHCSAFVASTASAPNPRRCSNQRFSNLLRHTNRETRWPHVNNRSFFFTQQHTKTVTKKNLPLLPFCCFLFFLLPAAASSAFFFFFCAKGELTHYAGVTTVIMMKCVRPLRRVRCLLLLLLAAAATAAAAASRGT